MEYFNRDGVWYKDNLHTYSGLDIVIYSAIMRGATNT